MSEQWAAILIAVITVAGVIASAWIGSHSAVRRVRDTLDTGNGHTAGEAISNIEAMARLHAIMLAEHAAALQALNQTVAGTNGLLIRHIEEVGPGAEKLSRWVREQMAKEQAAKELKDEG